MQPSLTAFEDRRIEQLQGVGAETLLRVLGPVIQEQYDKLIIELITCDPTLEKLLKVRGEIAAIHRIKTELSHVANRGKEASEALQDIFSPGPRG